MKEIYFLGPKASYSDIAQNKFKSLCHLESYTSQDRKNFTAVVSDLVSNNESLAVLPIENYIEGVVTGTVDNLIKYRDKDIKILAETVVDIEHCLITYAKDYSEVKTIISHQQALSQCYEYIYNKFGDRVEIQSETSTAKAVSNLSENQPYIAAIGNEYAAKLYNKPIIDKQINDEKSNQTRFILVGNSQSNLSICADKFNNSDIKTSLVFTTENKSGALCEILGILKEYEINMTQISSRPSRKVFGEYLFYVDFEGSITDKNTEEMLQKLYDKVTMVEFLGSYPRI